MAAAWNGEGVRRWLEARIVAARADQVAAERAGYGHHDDCDKATAEDLVCTTLIAGNATDDQKAFADRLRSLLEREEYIARGVYDDTRFDRHVRSYIRKLTKMTRANEGFDIVRRYQ